MKVTKQSADYSHGHRDAHCGKSFPDDTGYCRHFQPGSEYAGSCELVQGAIKVMYWCRLFVRAVSS